MNAESVDLLTENGLPSTSSTQEPQFTALGLASEVELSEQPIVVEEITEETAAVSRPTALQGIPPSSSSSVLPNVPGSTVLQGSADLLANGVTVKGNETRASTGYGRMIMQQMQGQATQVVAILPSQVRLYT